MKITNRISDLYYRSISKCFKRLLYGATGAPKEWSL